MAFGRKINLFLIVLLLGAQLALAQHATVHFTAHGHAETGHDEPDGHDPRIGDLCQICILAKGFQSALAADQPVVPLPVYTAGFVSAAKSLHFPQLLTQAYQARAPPAFLS